MCGNVKRDKMRNECILAKVIVALIEEMTQEIDYDGLAMYNLNPRI